MYSKKGMYFLILARCRRDATEVQKFIAERLAGNLFHRNPEDRDRGVLIIKAADRDDGVKEDVIFDIDDILPGHEQITLEQIKYVNGMATGTGGWCTVIEIHDSALLWELCTGAFMLVFDIQVEPLVNPFKDFGDEPVMFPEQPQVRRLVGRRIGGDPGW